MRRQAEVDFEGTQILERGDHRSRRNEISQFDLADSGDSRKRRPDPLVGQDRIGFSEVRPGPVEVGLGAVVVRMGDRPLLE